MLHFLLVRPPLLVTEPRALLLPPYHNLGGSCPPLLQHCNVKNCLCRNVIDHTVVVAGDVLPNNPQILNHQILTNRGVLPLSGLAPRHICRNPPHYLIIHTLQRLQKAGCYDPQIRSKKKYRLDHHHIESPRGPGISLLAPQQAVEPYPAPLRSLEVTENGRPVTVIKEKHMFELSVCIHFIYNMVMGL